MQSPDNHQNQEDEALQAPPELVSALKRLPKEKIFIPPAVDQSVLRAAQRHLGKPEKPRCTWYRLFSWAAAATGVILLLAALPHWFNKATPGGTGGTTFAREDLNHDGHVDILDAFALARQLKAGGTPSLQQDMNGDGVVDERDVATIAARAVRLEKGGRS